MTSILVVDDDAITKMAIKTVLETLGYVVETVSNGFEALKTLENKKICLIFLDINMPVMDGHEFVKALRNADGNIKNIPVIGISAYLDNDGIEKAYQSGMNKVFKKPISVNQLKEWALNNC
ncbi:MAG TPA: response regulator [Gammaproteobacteria bacterium]|nr:response regulator [Gammaproteobacteria bacterium]